MTLSVMNNITILLRKIFTNLIVYILAFLLIRNCALRNKVGDTLPLSHRLALVLKPHGTFLIMLSSTSFLMNCDRLVLGDLDTLKLGSIVTLFIICNRVALLVDVSGSLTLLSIVDGTELVTGELLNRSLSYGTLPLLSLSADLVRNISTLLSGHRLVGLFGNLLAHFLGNLLTNWLGSVGRTRRRRMGSVGRTWRS